MSEGAMVTGVINMGKLALRLPYNEIYILNICLILSMHCGSRFSPKSAAYVSAAREV